MSEAKKMEEEIKALRKDVDYLKKNMVDPDSIMTEDDFEKLLAYREEKEKGELISEPGS